MPMAWLTPPINRASMTTIRLICARVAPRKPSTAISPRRSRIKRYQRRNDAESRDRYGDHFERVSDGKRAVEYPHHFASDAHRWL